jgi:hypothetical protein
MLLKLWIRLSLQEQRLVVVSFVVVLTTGDRSLYALYSDLQLSLPFPVLHDVAILVSGATSEADHSNFEALGLFLSAPEPAPEGYELHS